MNLIYALLVFLPVAAGIEWMHGPPAWAFVASMLAIVPLAKAMGTATEEVALRTGPGVGGLLNATFGNATELIIALFALNRGLHEVVKASITGSIIGNLLFVFGLAVFMGGMRYASQEFNKTVASLNTSLLMLAVVGLMVPAGYAATIPAQKLVPGALVTYSAMVALVLIAVYAASLFFALKTHKDLYAGGEGVHDTEEEPQWSVGKAVGVLLASTLGVAFMSEILVGSIEHVTKDWGLSPMFIGIILVPIVGNAAEHLTAVTVAMKGKMDLSLGIAIGSTTQIALFVAPFLVLAGLAMGKPIDLVFTPFEILAVALAVMVTNFITLDGETNWLEGLMLLSTYGILAMAFFMHP